MPQAPLPAPANRIQVPELIKPIVQPFMPPPNVLPYQRLPDMLSAAQRGIQLGSMVARLPREAHENAAASASAAIYGEGLKALQDQIKYIQGAKNLSADQRLQMIAQAMAEGGYTFSGGQGGLEPLGGMIKAQNLASAVQAYQHAAQAFPTEQQQREQNLEVQRTGTEQFRRPPPGQPQTGEPAKPSESAPAQPKAEVRPGGEPAVPFSMGPPITDQDTRLVSTDYGGFPMVAPVAQTPEYDAQLWGGQLAPAPIA